MDELTSLPNARVQIVLKQLLLVLDDVISHPNEESFRTIARDELPGMAARLLLSCGFLESAPGILTLPPGVDFAAVRDARDDFRALLKKAEESRGAVSVPGLRAEPSIAPSASQLKRMEELLAPKGTTQTIQVGSAAARALKASAARVSGVRTNPDLEQWELPGVAQDRLAAGKATPIKRRGAEPEKPKELTKTIPPEVQAAAAQVSQEMALRLSHGFGGKGLGIAKRVGTHGGRTGSEAAVRSSAAGGNSTWTSAPPGVTAESRIVVNLPEADFTYIERPWSHFVTRWAAIHAELEKTFEESPSFTLVDLGSCNGFFSLQAAAGYPQSTVVGIEGSVGVGNGTTGVQGTEEQIIQTKAIQTHLGWIEKLTLSNCFLAPEVWDYRRIQSLANLGRPIADVMLSLSVIHHIDNVSVAQYEAQGWKHLDGTIQLVAKLLLLAPRHFIELPDRPWIEHVHNAFSSHRAFLEAAAQATGRRWSFVGPLCVSVWYGTRELWLMEEMQTRTPMPLSGLKALFPRILGNHMPQRRASAPALPHQPAPQRLLQASAPARILTDEAMVSVPPARTLQHRATVHGSQVASASAPPRPFPAVPTAPPSTSQGAGAAGVTVGANAARGRPLTPEELGAGLLAAPTALIASHVQLRDAARAAEQLLRELTAPVN